MRRTKISILILVFLLLGTYVYLYEIDKGGKEEKQVPVKVKVLDIKPEDVQEIVIKKEDQSVTLTAAGDCWRIKGSAEANVSKEKVYDLLSFFDYGIVREIAASPTDLKEYGLDSPRYEFWIKTKGDDKFEVLLIGGDAPGSISCYGKVKDRPEVVLLGVRYRQEIKRALTNFLRKAEPEGLKDSPLLINRDAQ